MLVLLLFLLFKVFFTGMALSLELKVHFHFLLLGFLLYAETFHFLLLGFLLDAETFHFSSMPELLLCLFVLKMPCVASMSLIVPRVVTMGAAMVVSCASRMMKRLPHGMSCRCLDIMLRSWM